MKDRLKQLGRRILNPALIVLALLACATALYLLLRCSSDSVFSRLLQIMTALSPSLWPIVTLLIILVFYASLREAIAELPAFVRRSHYDEGDVVVSDVSIDGSGREITVVHIDDNAHATIKIMRSKDYSACPVLREDQRFYGVFTIDAWIDYGS